MPILIIVNSFRFSPFPVTPIDTLESFVAKYTANEFIITGLIKHDWKYLEKMRYLSNFFVELSILPIFNAGRAAKKLLGIDHVLFGTGFCTTMPEVAIERMEHAGFTDEEKRKVYYENASRLLRV